MKTVPRDADEENEEENRKTRSLELVERKREQKRNQTRK